MQWLLNNPIFRTRHALKIRNKIGYRPSTFYLPYVNGYASASDLFLWRNDEKWKTVFRVSDTAKKYFGISSKLKVVACDHQNNRLEAKYLVSLMVSPKFLLRTLI